MFPAKHNESNYETLAIVVNLEPRRCYAYPTAARIAPAPPLCLCMAQSVCAYRLISGETKEGIYVLPLDHREREPIPDFSTIREILEETEWSV
jgi:hypothetical protein